LSWTDNSNNETEFKIERSTDAGVTFTEIATVGANVTTYADTGLTQLTTYSYRVRASNSAGDSAYSNTATVALVLPAAPTNLAASGVGNSGQVNLTWTDNSNNETGFQVERSTDSTFAMPVIAPMPANTTSYRDSNAVKGQTYYYRVAAINIVGLSAYSNVVTTP
jgi:fibronectin type 3 domain-containing protein